MPYPWECIDCDEYYEDLVKNGSFYCSKMHRNVSLHERSCNTYFVKRDPKRPLQYPRNNCYITTAVVHILGYEDDCETLETLRDFRDNYMKTKEEYLPLLDDYDVVGPLISDSLNKDVNKEKVAKTLLRFIENAIDAINDREYDAAVNTYESMTYFIMDYYEIDTSILTSTKGRQRKRSI